MIGATVVLENVKRLGDSPRLGQQQTRTRGDQIRRQHSEPVAEYDKVPLGPELLLALLQQIGGLGKRFEGEPMAQGVVNEVLLGKPGSGPLM